MPRRCSTSWRNGGPRRVDISKFEPTLIEGEDEYGSDDVVSAPPGVEGTVIEQCARFGGGG